MTEEVLDTPREVLRATGAFRVLAGMVGEEVDTLDLLAFSALHTKFPSLSHAIRVAADRFTPDYTTMRAATFWLEDSRERGTEKRLAKRFPGVDLPGAARSLILFLFPGIAKEDERSEPGRNALRHRRALTTVRRLGLPPGTVSRAEAERLFRVTDEEALVLLRTSLGEGRLADLLDRAAEVYPLMAEPSDSVWPAAGRFFRRSRGDWIAEYPPLRGVIDDVAALATGRFIRHPDEADRFTAVARGLRDAREAHLLPIWLNWHRFAFGLFGTPRRPDYATGAFLGSDTAEAWIRAQADWVRAAFCSGDLFFELYHPLVLHQLAIVGRWDEACRQRLEELLRTADGVDQFALLFFGGYHSAAWPDLERLGSVALIAERASERGTRASTTSPGRCLLRPRAVDPAGASAHQAADHPATPLAASQPSCLASQPR
jgi:hypothetical protein